MKTPLLLFLAVAGLHAQTLITVTGPVNKANGTGWTGKILLSNPDMICGSVTVTAGAQVITVINGVMSATLYATADCLPAGSSYLAEYTPADLSLPSRWSIPSSPTTITVAAIQSPGTAKPDGTIALPRLGFGTVLDGQFIKREGLNWVGSASAGGAWGGISGDILTQADLLALFTKARVGLGNVDNTSDANKPISTAAQAAFDLKAPLASPTFTGTVGGITKAMVGLGSVDNTADASKPVSTAQQAALDLKANLASPTFTGTVAGVTKSMVGLGSVDNTADADKPVSSATTTALGGKQDKATSGVTAPATTPAYIGQVFVDTLAALPYTAACTTSAACWVVGGSTGIANLTVTFTAQTTVAIPHNTGIAYGGVWCTDASGKKVNPGNINTSDPNTAYVTFGANQDGTCTYNATGGSGSGSGTGISSVTVGSSGAGVKVVKDSVGATVTGKTLLPGSNVTFDDAADTVTVNASVSGSGSYTAGTGIKIVGSVISLDGAVAPIFLCGTVYPAWTSITAGNYQDQSVTLLGILDGDALMLGQHASLAAALDASVAVTAADTVRIRLRNLSGGSITPATLPFKICTARLF